MRMKQLAALAVIAGSMAVVQAGPPMVCHEIVIGEAKSLPWDGGRGGSDSGYSTKKLVGDTVKLLEAEPSPLVRMETIRRAAVYTSYEEGAARGALAWELAATLINRAAEAGDSAGAWFDAGYLIGCYNQIGMDVAQRMGVEGGIPGYEYVLKGIKLAAGSKDAATAEMEFGAALITHPAMRAGGRDLKPADEAEYSAHLRRAVGSAEEGSRLKVNLAAHLKRWGKSVEEYGPGPGEIAGRR